MATTQAPTPDPKAPSAPATTPQPTSLANWQFPRLPQPFDIVEGMGGGGGGGGGPSPSSSAPTMNTGTTGQPGTSGQFSRGNHVHPSDTSRLALSGGTLSGMLTLSAAPTANNHAATKAYVDAVTAALTALAARVTALEGTGPSLSAPLITSGPTANGQAGVAFSFTITASGNPAPTFSSTDLPWNGLSLSGNTISGTPTTAAPSGHNISIKASNSQGDDTKTLVVTIAPAAVSTPWEVTFSFSNTVVSGTPNIGGVVFPPNGNIPLNQWTGWQASYAADVTDDLYNATSQAALPIQLYAKYATSAEVQVPFDNWGPHGTGSNQLQEWGYNSGISSITVAGNNSTGAPIALRLVKA